MSFLCDLDIHRIGLDLEEPRLYPNHFYPGGEYRRDQDMVALRCLRCGEWEPLAFSWKRLPRRLWWLIIARIPFFGKTLIRSHNAKAIQKLMTEFAPKAADIFYSPPPIWDLINRKN